ncbi:MAG: hypothetical protein A2Z02_06385 [Chloroflexi bacterium RBG_16_48_7]|nr:MAG: hypothetical protein A2Z02_06385 [Chloroflexi bacterium RBG_16_48_7]
MVKRIKKPAIKQEKRLEWLKRAEQGETVPKIAEADQVDVRTVRKHVELGRMERDMQQARSAVLRDSLEGHYRDLLDTARNIENQVNAESQIAQDKDVPLMYGLHQHTPRSPLWENTRKWNRTVTELGELEAKIRNDIQTAVEADDRLKGLISKYSGGIIPAVINVLVHQVNKWTRGEEGLIMNRDFHIEKTAEGRVLPRYGFSNFGEIEGYQVETLKAVLVDVEVRIKQWPECSQMENLLNRLSRLKKSIREVLTTIILRRILPGKCKYCPL